MVSENEEVAYKALRVVAWHLAAARNEQDVANQALNAIADTGKGVDDSRRFQVVNRLVVSLLKSFGQVEVKTVRDVEGTRLGDMPQALKDQYETLWVRVYGKPVVIGDADAKKVPSAGAGYRTSSGKTQHRGPASKGKSATIHRRNVIQDQRAYDEKRRIDKKLTRIARDIRAFLAGEAVEAAAAKTCPSCGRIGEQGWRCCPACGDVYLKG